MKYKTSNWPDVNNEFVKMPLQVCQLIFSWTWETKLGLSDSQECSKRCLMVCVHKPDRSQDEGEMLQMAYLAVFIITGVLCIKCCLESFKEFLVLTTDLFLICHPKFWQLACFQNVWEIIFIAGIWGWGPYQLIFPF